MTQQTPISTIYWVLTLTGELLKALTTHASFFWSVYSPSHQCRPLANNNVHNIPYNNFSRTTVVTCNAIDSTPAVSETFRLCPSVTDCLYVSSRRLSHKRCRLEPQQRVCVWGGRGMGGIERTEPTTPLLWVPLLIQIQPLPCSIQLHLTSNLLDYLMYSISILSVTNSPSCFITPLTS